MRDDTSYMTNLGMGGPGESAPAGWYSDPFERHQLRFWDGSAWTDRVSDRSYNRNLWMHHLNGDAAYLPV
jgi:hypothetical protein